MKKLLIINLGLAVATSSFASTPFIPKFVQNKLHQQKTSIQKSVKSQDGYPDFSGNWVGTCDNTPDEQITMNIEQSPDASSMLVDGERFPIDAIVSNGTNENFAISKNMVHIRWSEDGQQLLGTGVSYSKEGNLSQGDMNTAVGSFVWSIDNGQFINTGTFSVFTDGSLFDTINYRCTFKKS